MLNNGKCILDFRSARNLTAKLKANEFHFEKFHAKLSIEAVIDSSAYSFSVALRMKKDSIIWMSISKLGIEVAKVLVTRDTVKFYTINNKYFIGDFAYISRMLATDLDFEILQSLLVGNSVEFYDDDEKIKSGVDRCQYTLGTIRKFKLHKVIQKGKELKEPAQSIYLIPVTFKIARILFFEFNPERSFDARFGNYQNVDTSQLFPMQANFIIKAQKNISFDIIYSNVVLNEEKTFPFKIPENYEKIVTKEKQ